MKPADDPYGLLTGPTSVSTVVDAASRVTKRFSALFVAAHCTGDPSSLLDTDGSRVRMRKQGAAYVATLGKSTLASRKRVLPPGRFGIVPSGAPNIWLVFTFETLAFVNKRLDKILRQPAGCFATFHMDTSEMREALDDLADNKKLTLDSVKAITYQFGGAARVDYARRSHREVFASAHEEQKYVDSLRFEARYDERMVFNATVFRNCSGKFFKGDFDLFWNDLIPRICRVAGQKANLYLTRERTSYIDKVKPLAIAFKRDVFSDSEQISSLVSALSKEGRFTVAVHHANPYLRATVTDFADGSAIDVYVTSPRSVSIIPGFHSSIASLSRLTKVFSERVGEGVVGPEILSPLSFNELAAD